MTRRRDRRRAGLSLVEVLVALGILSIVSTTLGVFLDQQSRHASASDARSELAMNLRGAAELVATDLYSAGSTGVPADCDPATLNPVLAINDPDDPVTSDHLAAARRHTLTVRYCDPYRRVATTVRYHLEPDAANDGLWTLHRNDEPAVTGILGLEFVATCRPGSASIVDSTTSRCDPTLAAFDPADLLLVTVKMAGHSPVRALGVTDSYLFDGVRVEDEESPNRYYDYLEQAVRPLSIAGDSP